MLPNQNAKAWLVLVGVVSIHVFDEAVTGFLPFYNALVTSLKDQWTWFPMPVFPSFEIWLGGLILGLLLGLFLLPAVAGGGRGIRIFVAFAGLVMISNALGHLLGSVYFGRPIPGFWSSFLLLPASCWVTFRGFKGDWRKTSR